MSNEALAKAAKAAIQDNNLDPNNPNYPDDPGVFRRGMCSRFVRCCVRKVYGDRFANLFGPSAISTGRSFANAGYAVSGPLQPSDILVKLYGDGPYGHIAIYCDNQHIAENSSSHPDGEHGAKGYRTRDAFGDYDEVIRLPAPAGTAPGEGPPEEQAPDRRHYLLLMNNLPVGMMPVWDTASGPEPFCQVHQWAAALGLELDYDRVLRQVILGGRHICHPLTVQDSEGYLPVRVLTAFCGLKMITNREEFEVQVRR